MSAALEISVDSPGLDRLEQRIRSLAAGLDDKRPLLAALGAELETRTKRRIESGGPAPDGTPWLPWSDAYARTRHGNQGLLMAEGDLLDSIQSLVHADRVETGSILPYAALHQLGGTPDMPPGPREVPAREYLGISADDEGDLDAVLTDHFGGLVREALT